MSAYKRVISGWEFGKALAEAGILPPNCGDLIIEVPVGGVVTIHTCSFGDERLLDVIGSSVQGAKLEMRELPEAANERTTRFEPSSEADIQPPTAD